VARRGRPAYEAITRLEVCRRFLAEAANQWETILFNHPKDILALKFAHDSHFSLGNWDMMRDSVARVLPQWKDQQPFYG
jgi:hypothetical protein